MLTIIDIYCIYAGCTCYDFHDNTEMDINWGKSLWGHFVPHSCLSMKCVVDVASFNTFPPFKIHECTQLFFTPSVTSETVQDI